MLPKSNKVTTSGGGRDDGGATPRNQAALADILTYLKEYCNYSGIHGFRYLSEERRNCFEKMFWATAIAVSAFGCSLMISKIKTKMDSTPIRVTLAEHPTKIWHVPFPAITLCPDSVSRLTAFNFTKYADLAAKNVGFQNDFLKWVNERKNGEGADYFQSNDSFQFPVNHNTFNGSSFFENATQRNSLYKKLWALHTIRGGLKSIRAYPGGNKTLTLDEDDVEFLVAIAPTLHSGTEFPEKLRNVMLWRSKLMPIENHFRHLWTEYGVCFTFNMMNDVDVYRDKVINNDVFNRKGLDKSFPKLYNDWDPDKGYSRVLRHETYPWRVPFERKLESKVLYIVSTHDQEDIDKFWTKGALNYRMAFHQPQDLPQFDVHSYVKVPLNKAMNLAVNIDVMTTSIELKKYDPYIRGCYYSHEKRLEYFKFYSQNNCQLECMTNISLKMCGCVSIYMPRYNTTKICGRDAYACLSRASVYADKTEVEGSLNHFFDSDESPFFSAESKAQCHCLPACLSITYEPDIYATDDLMSLSSIRFSDYSVPDTDESLALSSTHIVVRKRFFIANQRNEYYGQLDFLANCGGFLGLFCGFSILSVIEIIYFLTIRLWTNVYRRLTSRPPPELPEGLPSCGPQSETSVRRTSAWGPPSA